MKNAILHIASQLQAAYPPDEAEALAWWIAEELSGQTRTELLFGCKDTTFLRNTQTIIDRLLHFEPIQYIFGHTIWNGLDLKLTPATLIPRPETAELVERINRQIANNLSPFRGTKGASVLDIGTGSGCIAIALKKAHPEWQVTGIDISPEAIAVAKENARRNNVEVNFLVADIFSDEIVQFSILNSQIQRSCQ
ncbi:MAG: peptide chain release factor N(5)-glutamine methyltransferase [Paludibacteraceae bacterium]|nr:peptide chain release factor N(5)-glutamine methyltransferase [Paludibacteraceae bacterium]